MISFRHKGDFSKTFKFLESDRKQDMLHILERYCDEAVAALSSATPVDSGETAASWYYQINTSKSAISIDFFNSNYVNGVPIAVILQYGHATKNGGWVEGIDYINPAIRPIFDKIAKEAWKEVTK